MSRIGIKSIHIKNYRSIKDVKIVDMNNKTTVFAGKNESGKTNILKAIQTFYLDDFNIDDIPVDDMDCNPEVKINFEISREYIKEKLNTNIEIDKDKFTLCVTRSKNERNKYEGSVLTLIGDIFYNMINKIYISALKLNKRNVQDCILEILNSKEEEQDKILKKFFFISNDNEEDLKNFDNILNLFSEIKVKNIVNSIIPQVVYFDSFEDMLPDELNKDDIFSNDFETKNKAFVNLLHMLNINKDDFIKKIEGNERSQSSEFKKISKEITQKYNSVYLQEKVSIGLNKNGDKIFVQIFDEGDMDNDKKPSQRSKGFQWFISFYLLLNSIDKDAIILIDEPGLYLHAKAQEDILKFLNEEIENTILFTTHSPYLIDINKLDSLNLVRKSNELGTVVNQKYYNCSDQDTITPLITAIGYNVAKNPIEIGKGLNIITEGISDRFYLLGFLRLMNNDNEINIIPSTGSSNVHLLVSLAIGWNLDFFILLDNDQGGKDCLGNIKKLFQDKEEVERKIIYSMQDGAIEDIFSNDDKNKYHISKNKKVLSSYNFYNNVITKRIKKEELSEETLNNIENLISKLR